MTTATQQANRIPELKTRRPTGYPSWPIILVAGVQKSGKSYAAAALSASDLIDRTFWIEVGEASADLYGALPGARFEIVEHDGSFASIANAAWAATKQPSNGKPHVIVIDSMTEVWDLLADEQQVIANRRAVAKARRSNKPAPADDATITMDQWNVAKKRWRKLLDVLRQHNGPVILTTRFERVTIVGPDGKPTAEQEWKIRAEKNLPYEVDAIVEMPAPREVYLRGLRSLKLQVPPGGNMEFPNFSLHNLLVRMGFGEGVQTAPRAYIAPNPDAVEGPHQVEKRRHDLLEEIGDLADQQGIKRGEVAARFAAENGGMRIQDAPPERLEPFWQRMQAQVDEAVKQMANTPPVVPQQPRPQHDTAPAETEMAGAAA